ncbi:hypothetical protein AOQ84DRAFT_300376 [Glonium stellatum]|uniref:Transcription elongation factor Eaf N-terminal domain-containing protein n=1 Tax=Glonium stellatum TaxID=574774 RepID=A0A8E2EU05_9PEZI|nr:hypothetical protein AOQ84DRAFT_300376 [Glonium stellatum]
MASPLIAASSPRILDPHKKGHFNLQLSERLTKPGSGSNTFTSIKFNHKPQQTSQSRTATLAPSTDHQYTLTLSDKDKETSDTSAYTFRGQRTRPKKSYVLIFDPAKQTCTLEPLSASYTFNLKSTPTESSSTKLAQQYPQIQPPKGRDYPNGSTDLFDEDGGSAVGGSDSEPDADNPYDFRHFLSQSRRDASSGPSSPDVGTGSAINTPRSEIGRSTPLVQARKQTTSASTAKAPQKQRPAAAKSAAQPLNQRKRKSPPPASTTTEKKANPTPSVRIDRRASTRPSGPSSTTTTTTTTKASTATSTTKSSKQPKSSELVHSSDSEAESGPDTAALTIEIPDAHPPRGQARGRGALASLGLGQNIGLGGYLKSPSNGPISLHSAANSASGSPDSRAITPAQLRQQTQTQAQAKDEEEDDGVIDFGDLGGDAGSESDVDEVDAVEAGYDDDDEEEVDLDVEVLELGPPATQQQPTKGQRVSVSGLGVSGVDDGDDDMDADFEAEMLQGLVSQEEEERQAKAFGAHTMAGGDSESESEEE